MSVFLRLTPVLPVADVAAERTFYEALGFARYVDPSETYPDDQFAAFESGDSIRFGVAAEPHFDATTAEARLWWQFETSDIDAVHDRARNAALEIDQPPAMEPWGRRTLKVRSPDGYLVTFEEA